MVSRLEQHPGPNFTVHHFTKCPVAESFLLAYAAKIIDSSSSEDSKVWIIPGPVDSDLTPSSAKSYIYAPEPPRFIGEAETKPIELKDWDTPVSDDEIWGLEQLEDFVSLKAPGSSALNDISVEAPALERNSGKRTTPADLPLPSQPKRSKVDPDSAWSIIPQPHFYPSPFMNEDPPVMDQPYTAVKPVYLSPYTSFPLSSRSRVGWLIPVSGDIPWEGASSGSMLSFSSRELSPPLPGAPERISWTPDSLLSFWNFLLDLRKAGLFGPLAIAFEAGLRHIRPAVKARSSRHLHRERSTKDDTLVALASKRLSSIDYIKVHHDASQCLNIRNMLDSWLYDHTDLTGVNKIGLLKGARLVLVDAQSKGIQIL